MAYERYTVNQFMKAWFSKDYSEMSHDEFVIVYSEYVDVSGLYMSDDFERIGYINHLRNRITFVKLFLDVQSRFIIEFGIPFVDNFEYLKEKYGYVLKWKGNLDEFEKQFAKIVMRERKFEDELISKVQELEAIRNNTPKGEPESDDEILKKSRISFVKMMNSLGKVGYKIEKNSTSVEEMALMIRMQLDELEKSKFN